MNNTMKVAIPGTGQQEVQVVEGDATMIRQIIQHTDSRCMNCGDGIWMDGAIPRHKNTDEHACNLERDENNMVLVAPGDAVANPEKVSMGWIRNIDSYMYATQQEHVQMVVNTQDSKYAMVKVFKMSDGSLKAEFTAWDGQTTEPLTHTVTF